MKRISEILKQFISERIPAKATNIFFQMFNGIQAMFESLEYRLDISKRERNILTAQSLASLRSLAAQNGYEPKLRTPAKGIILMKVSPKLFNRVGYPLFIKPYSVFTNTITKLNYYYISDKTIRIDSNNYYIPVVEGLIVNQSEISSSDYIQRFYIPEEKVAEDSFMVEVEGNQFQEVKSFYDNEGINDNKQYMVKFSTNAQQPIIVYIKGLKLDDNITITYRLTNGELGNLTTQQKFETESIVDSYGGEIVPGDDEISIVSINGFGLGSNGTDANALRGAIGFNHSINLLFDNVSYRNFLSKFSTILVQDIKISVENKQINNIYLWKKNTLNPVNNSTDIILQYKQIIDYKQYVLPEKEVIELNKVLEEFEYCLSSHNLFPAKTCNYAFQIMFNSKEDLNTYKSAIEQLLYHEFSKFLYIRNYSLNLEILFDDFKLQNELNFEYTVFNQVIEQKKIQELTSIDTPYIIYHTVDGDKDYILKSQQSNKNYTQNIEGPYLPILKGDFDICDSEFKKVQLFFDINFVIRS